MNSPVTRINEVTRLRQFLFGEIDAEYIGFQVLPAVVFIVGNWVVLPADAVAYERISALTARLIDEQRDSLAHPFNIGRGWTCGVGAPPRLPRY